VRRGLEPMPDWHRTDRLFGWFFGVVLAGSLAFTGVLIWAVVALVRHFTGS
jgi:hypothetical protein